MEQGEQVIIDKGKCTACAICVQICPSQAIVMGTVAAEIRQECMLCGQCQAVCPVDAVALPQLPLRLGLDTIEESMEIIPFGATDISELVRLFRSRRSCRKYQQKAVPPVVLEDLVKIGTTAPSGTNSQTWSFHILPTREDVLVLGEGVADYFRGLNKLAANSLLRFILRLVGNQKLARYYRNYHDSVAEALRQWDEKGTDRLFHGAVAAILVGGQRDAGCPAEDALLASQNILLAAHALGLGSCLIGFAVEAIRRDQGLKRRLGITADQEIYSVIALGYPAVSYLRPANRKVVSPRTLTLSKTLEQDRSRGRQWE